MVIKTGDRFFDWTHLLFWSSFALLVGILAGCSGSSTDTSPVSPRTSPQLKVVATTGMVADAVRQIGGSHLEVVVLMGPGVDPHLYQPTLSDQSQLKQAQVVFYNGLHLEGRMTEFLEKLGKQKPVISLSRNLDKNRLLGWESQPDLFDPHIWFDVMLWSDALTVIAETLSSQDPAHASEYKQNLARYQGELKALHQDCLKQAETLEKSSRVLVTSHDAFHYFGRAYGFDVVGIQGISTETEAGLKAITDAVDLIRERKLRAIFPENSVPRAAIERVARDSGAQLGPELYSDALGPLEGSAGTYIGMIRTNFESVLRSLKGGPALPETEKPAEKPTEKSISEQVKPEKQES